MRATDKLPLFASLLLPLAVSERRTVPTTSPAEGRKNMPGAPLGIDAEISIRVSARTVATSFYDWIASKIRALEGVLVAQEVKPFEPSRDVCPAPRGA